MSYDTNCQIQSPYETTTAETTAGDDGVGVHDDVFSFSSEDNDNRGTNALRLPFILTSQQSSPPCLQTQQNRRRSQRFSGRVTDDSVLHAGVQQIISFSLDDDVSTIDINSTLPDSMSFAFEVPNHEKEWSSSVLDGHNGMIGNEQLEARLSLLETNDDAVLMDMHPNHVFESSSMTHAVSSHLETQPILCGELLSNQTTILSEAEMQKNLIEKIPEGLLQSESATKLLMELYYLCANTTGVPRGFFDRVCGIIHKHQTFGVSLDAIHFNEVSSAKIRQVCSDSVRLSPPEQVVVPLETARPNNCYHHRLKMESTIVPCFNIKELFLRKLSDRDLFGHLPNLVVNPLDRWNQTSFDAATRIGEVIPAQACQEYIKKMGLVTYLDFVIPISMYGDEIQVNLNGRMGVNPISIAFGIIECSLRHTDQHAETVGYIPTTDKRTKAQKRMENQSMAGRGRGARNFHTMNSVIMAQVKELQDYLAENPVWVQLGNEMRKVFVHAPLLMYLGDAKAMDVMAGRYGSYSQAKRISRYCDCSSENAGVPGHPCNKFLIQHVRPFVETIYREGATNDEVKYASAYLHSIGTHNVINSLWAVDIGLQLALPLPHDPMHIFSQIMKTIFQLLVAPLSNSEKVEFDLVVAEMLDPAGLVRRKIFLEHFSPMVSRMFHC